MNLTLVLQWIIRVAVLALCAIWFFGIMLPNAGPYPELQLTAAAAKQAALSRGILIVVYVIGFLIGTGFILLGGKRKSQWQIAGWIVVVEMSLFPALK